MGWVLEVKKIMKCYDGRGYEKKEQGKGYKLVSFQGGEKSASQIANDQNVQGINLEEH